MVRLPSPEVVQAAHTGQGWHWLLVNLATMSGAASGEEVGCTCGSVGFSGENRAGCHLDAVHA